MARCKKCGAVISWTETPWGKWIPTTVGYYPYWGKGGPDSEFVTNNGYILHLNGHGEGEPDGYFRVPHRVRCGKEKSGSAIRREIIGQWMAEHKGWDKTN